MDFGPSSLVSFNSESVVREGKKDSELMMGRNVEEPWVVVLRLRGRK